MTKLFKARPYFVFSAVFTTVLFFLPARLLALTADQIQAQIVALQQQLNQLMGQTTVVSTIPSSCSEIGFSRNLSIGMSGSDVRCLQAILNQSADTRIAATGIGSPGNESSFFGALTQAAVVRFQNKYAASVLAPAGLSAGTGYVGALTRAKLNELLAAITVPITQTTPTTPITSTTSPNTVKGITITGQEGMISATTNPSPANGVRVYEGDAKDAVMGIKVQATGSDVSILRVNFEFDSRIYDYLNHIYLYDGNTLLADRDLNSNTVNRISSALYTITLDNFKTTAVVRKDTSRVLTVKVDALNDISSKRLPDNSALDLKIRVAANGVRALDQANLNKFSPSNNSTIVRTFSIRQKRSTNASMAIDRADNSPTVSNIVADSKGNIRDLKLLVFTVAAKDDDLTIDEINNVQFTTGSSYLVPDTVYLYDDNDDIIDSASPNKSTGIVNFRNLNTRIDQGDSRSYTLKIDDSISTSGSENGKKYQVRIDAVNSGGGANFVVQKSDDGLLDANRMDGFAESDVMYVYLSAPTFDLKSVTTASTARTSGAAPTISAVFTIPITAKGGDIYIPKTGAFKVYYSRNDVLPGAPVTSITYAKPSNTVSNANSYKISRNTTATFVVNATYVLDGPTGSYKLYIAQIDWGTSDTEPAADRSTYISENFVSDYKYLQ